MLYSALSLIMLGDEMLLAFEVKSNNTNFQNSLNSFVEEDRKIIGPSLIPFPPLIWHNVSYYGL